jgi:hypothetical protein
VQILIFGAVIGLIIALAIWGAMAAKQRRAELASLSLRLGLSYRAEKDHEMTDRFEFLDALARGSNRYAYNILSGIYQAHEVLVFDYHYETHSTDSKGRRQTHHHHFSFFILMLPQSFPELLITREGFLSKLAQAFGYDDIDLESAEFSRTFCVRSKDKKFAYDVCNASMMEYLLAHRDLNIEIEDRALALAFGHCLAVPGIERNLNRLLEIRSRLPDYLFTKV